MKVSLNIKGIFFLAFLIISFSSESNSILDDKKRKVKFGKVSIEELKEKDYAPDTTADAVILYDAGYFNADKISFTRHVRIKILKNTGTKWGNWTLNTPSKNVIRGYVFNLDENEEIVREKIDKNSIYEEEIVDDFYVYKIFAPNVKVGSIIDIYYTHPGLPFEWRFQERIPIVYNELVIENSQYIQFSKTSYGFEKIEVAGPNKWISRDMPAFKAEPFVSTYDNYITKFEIQLVSISIPGAYYKEFSTTWEKVRDLLLNSEYFGGILRSSGYLNDKAKEINAKDISTEEKVSEAYDYIKDNIKWNGRNALMGSASTRGNFLKDHTGNSGEINLLLLSLLSKMDIKAYPVVLSTRDNGLLVPFSPMLNKLNYVIVYVEDEDYKVLLDASGKDLIPGILPEKCLNGDGLLLDKNRIEWVNLNNQYSKSRTQIVNIKLDENGSASASLTQNYQDYDYLRWKSLNETDVDNKKYLQSLKDKNKTIEVVEYNVEKNEPEALLVREAFQLDLAEHVVDIGDEIIFSPFLFTEYQENIFKSEKRLYPVDLAYPRKFSSIISVQIPEGYQIKSIPDPVRLVNSDKSMSFMVLSNNIGNVIQFNVKFNIERRVYTEAEYPELKQFYSYVVQKLSESIELSKVN